MLMLYIYIYILYSIRQNRIVSSLCAVGWLLHCALMVLNRCAFSLCAREPLHETVVRSLCAFIVCIHCAYSLYVFIVCIQCMYSLYEFVVCSHCINVQDQHTKY